MKLFLQGKRSPQGVPLPHLQEGLPARGHGRTLHEDGGVPLVQHAASRGAGGVEACRRSRVVGVVSGPSDPRYRAGGLWAVWSRESRSGHDGELFAALHKVFPCADHVRRALHAALMGEVAGIWPPGVPPTSVMSGT